MRENESRAESVAEQKARIRNRYKGINPEELDVIPAIEQENFYQDTKHKRVAVYARVSTDDPRQTSSYELQRNHYENLVNRHEGWDLIDIYADEGISGTSLQHRDAFNRMIEDCKTGKIDLIVTKSVSRFARNILDSIGKVRELKELDPPVGVFFETENIYTLNADSEMSLSFISTMAQEESHTKSEIMNSSIEMRFKMGIFLKPALLGYKVDENGELVIDKKEAKIVRLIFFLYLYGYSTQQIADFLTNLSVPTKKGKLQWSAGTISEILKNERHCGDILARKTWTPNYLNHKSKKNNQNRNQYLRKNDHEAIVSRSDFIAVQHMMTNARFKTRGVLPELEVISSGELSGFVITNFKWAGFTADDYFNACRSVDSYNRPSRFEAQEGEFDLRGFEVARTQFFNTQRSITCSITEKYIFFSNACASKLPPSEYVEVLLNPVEQLLVIRSTTDENRNAVRWCKKLGNNFETRKISSAAFIPTLFKILEWDENMRYKLSGIRRQNGNNTILIFDLKETEVFIPVKTLDPELEESIGETSRSRNTLKAYPPDWSDEFGEGYYEQKIKTTMDGEFSDDRLVYDNHPELTVTQPDELAEGIRSLVEGIKQDQEEAEMLQLESDINEDNEEDLTNDDFTEQL